MPGPTTSGRSGSPAATGLAKASSTRRRSTRTFLPLSTNRSAPVPRWFASFRPCIGAGTCVLLAAAGMALFGEYGAIAGLLLAVYPPAIFLDGLLEKSALVSFLTAALLYLVATGHTGRRVFFAGVILGFLSLTRENALLLAAPLLLWLLVHERRPLSGRDLYRRLRARALARRHRATTRSAVNFTSPPPSSVRTSTSATTPARSGFYEPLVPGHGAADDEQGRCRSSG